MQIVKLTLHNYKRFFLNDIQHLEYTPESKIQIILGSNGAGKSSLLEQLTPLPPNLKKDFLEGGYKEITISRDSDIYILTSSLDCGHSFKVNDIELNHNNKITVQLQLVLEHFGVTPNINQVLIGYNNFTDMSPNERKKWLTAMSSIDYSYAIKVYNNLRSRHRDVVGGIKLLQANIVKTEKGSLPDDVVNRLKNDKLNISKLVDHFFTLTKNQDSNNTNIELAISNVTKLVNVIQTNTTTEDVTIETLRDSLSKEVIRYEYIEDRLKVYYNELLEAKNVVTAEDKTKLVNELSLVKTNISKLLNTTKLPKLTNVESVYTTINSNYTDLVSLLSPLASYPNVIATADNKERLVKLVDRNKEILRIKEKIVYKLEERVANLDRINKESKEVACPECNHNWKPDYNSTEHNASINKLTTLRYVLTEVSNNLSKYETELEQVCLIRDTLTTFFKYFNVTTDLRNIFEYMMSRVSDISSIHTCIFTVFENTFRELNYLYPVVRLESRQQELETKLNLVEERERLRSDISLLNQDKIELNIKKLQADKNTNLENINNLNLEIKSKIKTKQLLLDLNKELTNVYDIKKSILKSKFNYEIKLAISRLREMLSDIDNKLSTNIEYETMLNTYQKELNQLKHTEKLLKIAVRELGPSEGLIAKSMSSFLNCFVQDMNYIIFMVWGTSMEILSCDILENDLDYKFKVLINNTDIVDDISKGSSSMKEVINLAFKIVFARYMGLTGSGLMLDEFGRTLDSEHRITSYEALTKELANEFNQVFLISHFCSVYGRFINSDVSILSTNGVDMTTIDKYNEVLKIS